MLNANCVMTTAPGLVARSRCSHNKFACKFRLPPMLTWCAARQRSCGPGSQRHRAVPPGPAAWVVRHLVAAPAAVRLAGGRQMQIHPHHRCHCGMGQRTQQARGGLTTGIRACALCNGRSVQNSKAAACHRSPTTHLNWTLRPSISSRGRTTVRLTSAASTSPVHGQGVGRDGVPPAASKFSLVRLTHHHLVWHTHHQPMCLQAMRAADPGQAG